MATEYSLRELARRTGYSLATVSMALRNMPKIPEETRRRIQEMAQETGYQANARISAAMRQIRKPARRRDFDTIAWLYQPYPEGRRPRHDHLRTMFEAANHRAQSVGWKIEKFDLYDAKVPQRALGRILYNRGIRAAVIPPFIASVDVLELDYSRLAVVAIGYSLVRPLLSRIGRASIDSMEVVFSELEKKGYRRPGFIQLKEEHFKEHRHPWTAFHYMQQSLPKRDRLPMLTFERMKEIVPWIRRHRPDVVIGDRMPELKEIRASGIRVPEDMGFVVMTKTPEDGDVAGLDPNYGLLAQGAVDQVIQMAQLAEYGVPAVPRFLLFEGTWRDGGTLRKTGKSSAGTSRKSR